MPTERVDFLDVGFDVLSIGEVSRKLAQHASDYRYVVTPNVDHLVRLRTNPESKRLYDNAALCLCDSRILRLLGRLGGVRLPLVPGSDLTALLFRDVIQPGDRIAIIGGSANTAEQLRSQFPRVRFYHHEAPFGLRTNPEARRRAAMFAAVTGARFTFIAVGSPQQEMIASEIASLRGARGTALCIGASLEFITGDQRRAPRWMQRVGMEWAHRLLSNPKRLWRRYLVDGVRVFPMFLAWSHRRSKRMYHVAAVFALVALCVLGVYASSSATRARTVPPVFRTPPVAAPTISLPPPDLLRPLTPEAAVEENRERPFVERADSPAQSFIVANAADRAVAQTCLAEAVYYEASGEGQNGMRAVAQVVLNRVRHPAYPATVCGVVYQGADRSTGCQFTFACDGALNRPPSGRAWREAQLVAESALSGAVFAPVGHATHYHADFVVPYWADSLDKSVQIGQHIFYRLPGALGATRTFREAYTGGEVDPSRTLTAPAVIENSSLLEAITRSSADLNAATPVASDSGRPELAADKSAGTLLVDLQPAQRKGDRPGCLTPRAVPAGSDETAAPDCPQ